MEKNIKQSKDIKKVKAKNTSVSVSLNSETTTRKHKSISGSAKIERKINSIPKQQYEKGKRIRSVNGVSKVLYLKPKQEKSYYDTSINEIKAAMRYGNNEYQKDIMRQLNYYNKLKQDLDRYYKSGSKSWITRTSNKISVLQKESWTALRQAQVLDKMIREGYETRDVDIAKLEMANYLSTFVEIDTIRDIAEGKSTGSQGLDFRIMELMNQGFENREEVFDYLNMVEVQGTVYYKK